MKIRQKIVCFLFNVYWAIHTHTHWFLGICMYIYVCMSFKNLSKKGAEVQVFRTKREDWENRGFNKAGKAITCFHSNSFKLYLLQNKCWFVFFLFTPYLSVVILFYGKNLVLLNLLDMSLLQGNSFQKAKTLWNSVK